MRIDGLLVVDKPEGITSMDVVREVKRRFRIKKAGHLGTLDPFATGVLPVILNEGTKTVPFLQEEPKVYEAVLKLGEETTTDDGTGRVTARTAWDHVIPEMIHSVFQSFSGKIRQRPPMFSAVKVQGKPLYQLARQGIEIERKEREVTILDLRVSMIRLPEVHFRVSCSRGTYIRALGRDIGRAAGCGGHLLRLRRVQSGSFSLDQAIPWEKLNTLHDVQEVEPWLIPTELLLKHLPEITGDERILRKVRFGREVVARDLASQPLPAFRKGENVRILSPRGRLVGIFRLEVEGKDIGSLSPDGVALKPLRIFPIPDLTPGGPGCCPKTEEEIRFCDTMIAMGSREQRGADPEGVIENKKEEIHGHRPGEEERDHPTVQGS
jgi:tRNA pseudouridine55 synthase